MGNTKWTTQYQILSGGRQEVEMQMNQLAIEEWVAFGSISVMPIAPGALQYSILMMKTVKVELTDEK